MEVAGENYFSEFNKENMDMYVVRQAFGPLVGGPQKEEWAWASQARMHQNLKGQDQF